MCKTAYSFRSFVFLSALSAGLGGTYLSAQYKDLTDCRPRWYGIAATRRFFTVQEIMAKMNREVRYTGPTEYGSTGRVVHFDPVDRNNRFFAVVYWDQTPDDGKPGVRFYDKDDYARYIEEQ